MFGFKIFGLNTFLLKYGAYIVLYIAFLPISVVLTFVAAVLLVILNVLGLLVTIANIVGDGVATSLPGVITITKKLMSLFFKNS